MKKFILFLIVFSTMLMAGIVQPFQSLSMDDISIVRRTDQNWLAAQAIKITVPSNSIVYVTTYISNWYDELADKEVGNIFNMSTNNYGYIKASELSAMSLSKTEYASKLIGSSGESIDITFYNDINPSLRQTTKGYLLDSFKESTDIYLYLTAADDANSEKIDSYQYVDDFDNPSNLVSRNYQTYDQDNNVRINFGTATGGHEFILVYKSNDEHSGEGASGQPLPGVLLASVISFASIFSCKKIKKKL